MTVSAKSIVAGVGARFGAAYVLDSAGLPMPAVATNTPYTGTWFEAIKEFSFTGAEPQRINHYGDDRIFAADILPPTEAPSLAITTGVDNIDIDLVLAGLVKRTIGTDDAIFLADETNKKGSEAQVALWFFRQALDAAKGSATKGSLRQYNSRGVNSARVVRNPVGGAQTTVDQTYAAVATPTTRTFWGESFSNSVWGCTEAAFVRGNTQYPGIWHFYRGSLGIGTFALSYLPVSSDAIQVWVGGSYTVPGSITYGASPAFSLTTIPAAFDNGTLVAALVQTADAF